MMALALLGLVSCSEKNEQYYRSHPKELQQALKTCPAVNPPSMTCDALQELGQSMNSLAYSLQSSPQGFGAKILALQETIAKQELALKNNKDAEGTAALTQNKKQLANYLAVVKWLESPES